MGNGNGNEDAYAGIVEPSSSGHADSGHGVHTDRSDGHIFELGNVEEEERRKKRDEREVGMDVDAVNGEGDKDRKSQARVWMSQCLCCKGPQSAYILSCRRYLYPWDLLLLLRLLPRLQWVSSATHLGIGNHTHQPSHTYTNACPQAMFSNPHIRCSRSRLDLKDLFFQRRTPFRPSVLLLLVLTYDSTPSRPDFLGQSIQEMYPLRRIVLVSSDMLEVIVV